MTWRVVVYDSIPGVTGSWEELEQHMMPYTNIFPLLLQRSGKFERYKVKFDRGMKLVSAPRSIVPINAQRECTIHLCFHVQLSILSCLISLLLVAFFIAGKIAGCIC